MARVTSMDALENKIKKEQEQVSKNKKQYDTAVSNLSALLDKRDALRRDGLVKAIMLALVRDIDRDVGSHDK